jgi:RNA 2',3'-cyclic 3'-phosphodiesterase
VRLFVAVFPTDEVRADLQRRLVPGAGDRHVRLTSADRWHVTLAFLGEVPDERRAEVERALTGVTAKGAFTLRLAAGGRFGKGRSTAVWAGVRGDLGALTDLHAGIRGALDDHGLAYDDRPLTPHLTLAYGRADVLLDGYLGPQWTVEEFVLVRSHHRDGGGYERLRSWSLGD